MSDVEGPVRGSEKVGAFDQKVGSEEEIFSGSASAIDGAVVADSANERGVEGPADALLEPLENFGFGHWYSRGEFATHDVGRPRTAGLSHTGGYALWRPSALDVSVFEGFFTADSNLLSWSVTHTRNIG